MTTPSHPGHPRIVLLVTSPRIPAGLLSAQAWELLRAYPVFAAAETDQVAALRAAGAAVTVVEPAATVLLDELTRHPTVVWLAGPGGDEELTRDLGMRLVRRPDLAELEVLVGSWDPPGSRLLDVVTVLDRLIAPGGDPWLSRHAADPGNGAGPHAGLAHYLLEEAYEAFDAMRAGDLGAVREELGDVLLQVVLHAAIGARNPAEGFTVDDVAGDLVAKMIRRNPHVFGGAEVEDLDEITRNWERIKREEKARTSVLDGIALSQPALTLAAQVLAKAERAGIPVPGVDDVDGDRAVDDLAGRLLVLVTVARAEGFDAEAELRRRILDLIEEVRQAESRA